MKISIKVSIFWFFMICMGFSLFADAALPKPSPQGFVNDFAGVLREDDRREIEGFAATVKEKTGAEIAVVTVPSFEPYGSIEEYALALFENWGIGRKGSDDGALLILAMNERKVKIEVGYGLEGAINDSMAGRILDTAVIPDFKNNNFSAGLVKGASVIAAVIAKEKGVDLSELNLPAAQSAGTKSKTDSNYMLFIIIAVYIIIVVLSIIFRKKGKRYGSGNTSYRGGGGYYGGGSSGRSGGGHSGGGFSGGRSGGGGASRGF